jgi:hypothetical protein
MVKVRDNQVRGHAMLSTLPAFPGRWFMKEFAEFLSCGIREHDLAPRLETEQIYSLSAVRVLSSLGCSINVVRQQL